jgi:hypothetical protein
MSYAAAAMSPHPYFHYLTTHEIKKNTTLSSVCFSLSQNLDLASYYTRSSITVSRHQAKPLKGKFRNEGIKRHLENIIVTADGSQS